ncbi:TIGR00375 family protein [Tumebacillus sp. ITR2]|uniref:TIGR00375 family protein n=1 Tax=Tumebacillus amylolyticus TaxID=2801339 RepID=A0ABS1JB90_9BACL|nr:endonuclease Q family protein [Tumebacillus amylolyticus]MBL0387550.1 TIGR00375 family protein [Tumebacillus amylolyticus]
MADELREFFLDLHIHIGRTRDHRPVKITAGRDLTFFEIIREAGERKGIEIIGIIDAVSPPVLDEIQDFVRDGVMRELPGGGYDYEGKTTLLLGAEVETSGPNGGAAHFGVWMRDIATMREFSDWLGERVTNRVLSSQRARCTSFELQQKCTELGGMFIINHAFTPHKSVLGNCVSRISEMVELEHLTALELGLSSDSDLADLFSEHENVTFVSNSDAHSLAKIGREYNRVRVAEPSFDEVKKALLRQDGRAVTANFGLEPKLGKYHRTFCAACDEVLDTASIEHLNCPACGSKKIVRGVHDRILSIADRPEPVHPPHRPPYFYQIPLEFIPKVGKKTIDKLLNHFGTEMNVLHRATEEQIADVVGAKIAHDIARARRGELPISVGGGGIYGKILNS